MNRAAALTATALAAAAAVLTIVPAQAAGSVHLTKIYYNSPGSDTRSNASLDAEYVVITNTTGAAVNLKGWVLVDASNHKYTFTSFSLAKGKSVTIHTGHGTNTATNRYWGSGNYIWNNDKDKATLKRASGAVQDTCAYNNAKAAWVNC
ncbi:lamin tail domain-containing protein [Streptacidiphilus sp. N1-10]|uniref:Lamin tail domain-containing protein n=1 Tax=Streptacidiphilus jeojiensis TaxID=3229225 RepID=A0ABV6XM21_9ACTN